MSYFYVLSDQNTHETNSPEGREEGSFGLKVMWSYVRGQNVIAAGACDRGAPSLHCGQEGGREKTQGHCPPHDLPLLARAHFLKFLEHLEIPLVPRDQASISEPWGGGGVGGHFVSKP